MQGVGANSGGGVQGAGEKPGGGGQSEDQSYIKTLRLYCWVFYIHVW
jgi:hypothetical protein